jgi:signal transduction histidine kinase
VASPSAAGLTLTPVQREAALNSDVFFTTESLGQRTRVVVTAAPLAGEQVLVAVGTDTDISDDAVERVQAALSIGGPLAVLLAAAGAWLLADAALRPVQRMRREADGIGDHDPDRRLAVPATRDEVAALGTTLNGVFDRLHSALQRERRFVADASHELRTPLEILRTELDLAVRPGRTAKAMRAAIDDAGQETDRLIRLTEDLLLLARADNHETVLQPVPIELRELLSTSIRRGRARDHQPPVVLDCSEELRVVADADRLVQIVDNLLDNAIRHSPPHTPVHLTATRDHSQVTIDVSDEGPGLPDEFQPRAFERFQRAEQADPRGTGLGLSVVRAIAQAHGGSADIANHPDGGARVTVRLPLLPPVTGSGTAGKRPRARPSWPVRPRVTSDQPDPADEITDHLANADDRSGGVDRSSG